jgi:membrane associated rhomboid family serine protease
MNRLTETVKQLIIINALVFLGSTLLGNSEVAYNLFSLFYPNSQYFKPWQIITHMFMHGDLMHIFFNMFALWMFGSTVEQVFGQKKFIFFYISAGLGAVALSFIVYYFQAIPLLQTVSELGLSSEVINQIINIDILDGNYLRGDLLERGMIPILQENSSTITQISQEQFKAFFDLNRLNRTSMVGASGAIMGILVAFGMLFPNSKLMLIFLPIPIKAKYFIPGIIILDLVSAVTGQSFFSPSNTAYVAHIGGALTGFLMMLFWKKNQFDKYRWN